MAAQNFRYLDQQLVLLRSEVHGAHDQHGFCSSCFLVFHPWRQVAASATPTSLSRCSAASPRVEHPPHPYKGPLLIRGGRRRVLGTSSGTRHDQRRHQPASPSPVPPRSPVLPPPPPLPLLAGSVVAAAAESRAPPPPSFSLPCPPLHPLRRPLLDRQPCRSQAINQEVAAATATAATVAAAPLCTGRQGRWPSSRLPSDTAPPVTSRSCGAAAATWDCWSAEGAAVRKGGRRRGSHRHRWPSPPPSSGRDERPPSSQCV